MCWMIINIVKTYIIVITPPLVWRTEGEKDESFGTTLFNRHYSEGDDPRIAIRVISDRPLIIWKMMKKKECRALTDDRDVADAGLGSRCVDLAPIHIDDQLQNVFIRRNKREMW